MSEYTGLVFDIDDTAIPDSQQAGVSSFPNQVTEKPVTLELTSSDECFLSNTSIKASTELATDSTYKYPFGLLDFVVECGETNGFTATVKQYFYDAPMNSFTLRKFVNNKYSTVTDASFDMQLINGRQALVVTYEVTDGGPLDADGVANGVIIDPAGPATVNVFNPELTVNSPNTGIRQQITPATIVILVSVIATALASLFYTADIHKRREN